MHTSTNGLITLKVNSWSKKSPFNSKKDVMSQRLWDEAMNFACLLHCPVIGLSDIAQRSDGVKIFYFVPGLCPQQRSGRLSGYILDTYPLSPYFQQVAARAQFGLETQR